MATPPVWIGTDHSTDILVLLPVTLRIAGGTRKNAWKRNLVPEIFIIAKINHNDYQCFHNVVYYYYNISLFGSACDVLWVTQDWFGNDY